MSRSSLTALLKGVPLEDRRVSGKVSGAAAAEWGQECFTEVLQLTRVKFQR